MSTVYTVGTIIPFANAGRTEGTIVCWDYDLAMSGRYTVRLNYSTGAEAPWNVNLRGIDFGGSTFDPDRMCVVGVNTLGQNANLNYSFILCFDRNTSTGVLTTRWNKIIGLNLWNTLSTNPGKNPGWEHIQMDDEYIYAATRGYRMNINNNGTSPPSPSQATTPADNQYHVDNPMHAAIAKFRISDGNIMWIKRFQLGTNNSTTGFAKGFTSLVLSPDVLYASLSVGDPVRDSVQYKGGGYDYIKIDPSTGLTNEGCSLVSQATMPNTNTVGGYQIVSGTTYNLTFTYTSGSSNVSTILRTLDATDLYPTVSNQWGINPEYVKYPLQPFDSSTNVSQSAVCTASLNQVYYYQGTASTLSQGDPVFSDIKGCSPLSNGYYKVDDVNNYYMIVSSGIAYSIANTCTLVPFLVGAGTSGNACNTLGSSYTYYHSGTGTYPAVGDIVYTNSGGTTPASGGTGTNYAVFGSGPPQPPISYFRITGSTGTVQAIGNCP